MLMYMYMYMYIQVYNVRTVYVVISMQCAYCLKSMYALYAAFACV